jgi:hypothetical protein
MALLLWTETKKATRRGKLNRKKPRAHKKKRLPRRNWVIFYRRNRHPSSS